MDANALLNADKSAFDIPDAITTAAAPHFPRDVT
jgi:hypothetical protein